VLKADDTGGIHGTSERISVESYEGMVRFYIQLIRNSAL
jgi:acetylornithine deacetylase/succinyl-diaminopimelate desuccinylase-like protein